jgi:hypothetical protein
MFSNSPITQAKQSYICATALLSNGAHHYIYEALLHI